MPDDIFCIVYEGSSDPFNHFYNFFRLRWLIIGLPHCVGVGFFY